MNALINDRGQLKGKLTRFTTYVNNLNNLHNSGAIINKKDILQLQARIESVGTLLQQYETVYSNIVLQALDDEAEDLLTNFENTFFEQTSLAKSLLKGLLPSDNVTSRQASPTPSNASSIQSINSNILTTPNSTSRQASPAPSSASSKHSTKSNASNNANACTNMVKLNLPKINLIKFNGDLDRWLEFKAIFQSMIHNNQQLSEINKLHYLKASLSNEPAELIQSLDFTEANYCVSWNTLIERYDRPKLILKNNLSAIINLKTIKQ